MLQLNKMNRCLQKSTRRSGRGQHGNRTTLWGWNLWPVSVETVGLVPSLQLSVCQGNTKSTRKSQEYKIVRTKDKIGRAHSVGVGSLEYSLCWGRRIDSVHESCLDALCWLCLIRGIQYRTARKEAFEPWAARHLGPLWTHNIPQEVLLLSPDLYLEVPWMPHINYI